MTVESKLGCGTTIDVSLPALLTASVSAAPEWITDPQQGGAGRILVMDDEPAVRTLAVNMLNTSGTTWSSPNPATPPSNTTGGH